MGNDNVNHHFNGNFKKTELQRPAMARGTFGAY